MPGWWPIQTRCSCAARPETARAAAILVSEDKLKQLAGGRKRACVAASVLTTDPYTARDAALPDVSTLTKAAARKAYETAGIGPEDLSLTELHDCFASAELVHYENLFLCKEGEAGKFIDEGGGTHPDLGGKVPVNVSAACCPRGIRSARPEWPIFARSSGI